MTANNHNPYSMLVRDDRQAMLKDIGLRNIEDLFDRIPASLHLGRSLALPPALNEWELASKLKHLASVNQTTLNNLSFLGGGVYEHYIPATIDAIVRRGDLSTAYTPYQPEMSQGLLKILYDFQQLMSKLLELPCLNSSVYDGSVALAESGWMMCAIERKRKVIAAGSIWPHYQRVLETYMSGRGVEIVWADTSQTSGQLDLERLESSAKAEDIAGILIQSPNCYGVLEQIPQISSLCKQYNLLLSVSCNPLSLGILSSPGSQGADIATCEGQPLGIPLSAGGAYLGIMATRREFQTYLPGRIVGKVTDINNQEAYALIKEQREQHVSREKATSHICSNQALNAMRAVIYLMTVGRERFVEIAQLNLEKSRYFFRRLQEIPHIEMLHQNSPHFNEALFKLNTDVEEFVKVMEEKHKIFPGIKYSQLWNQPDNKLLIVVTEIRSYVELDRAAKIFAEVIHSLPVISDREEVASNV